MNQPEEIIGLELTYNLLIHYIFVLGFTEGVPDSIALCNWILGTTKYITNIFSLGAQSQPLFQANTSTRHPSRTKCSTKKIMRNKHINDSMVNAPEAVSLNSKWSNTCLHIDNNSNVPEVGSSASNNS